MLLRLFTLFTIILFVPGCSDSGALPMATTPDKAKSAINTTLTNWKAGKTAEELKKKSPAIYFTDPDFVKGKTLVDFKIEDEGVAMGTGMRFSVTLNFGETTEKTSEKAKGKSSTKKMAYRVTTDPVISISVEDYANYSNRD